MSKEKRKKKRFLKQIDLSIYLKPDTNLEEIIKRIQNSYQDSSVIADLNEDEFYQYLNKKYPKILIVKHLGHYIIKDASKYDMV